MFFDACGGLVAGPRYDETEAVHRIGRRLTSGELGIYSSHYFLWTHLLGDSAEQYIILEDSAIVDWRSIQQLAHIDLHASGIDYLKLYFKEPVPMCSCGANSSAATHLLN